MGTSTMGSDLHSDKQDKLLKLQARKKELEQLLATKNEELYKLCVQEVQLTGIMPPEAPLSPEIPPHRERLDSIRSGSKTSDGDDVRDSSDAPSTRRHRHIQADKYSDQDTRKNLVHRLSTPSISGISVKSSHSRNTRRPGTSCSNYFPSPPQDQMETFSMHNSNTFPSLSCHYGQQLIDPQSPISTDSVPGPTYRQHTQETEYMNKTYYHNPPEAHRVSRLRETHFSSSHPDIPTHYNHGSVVTQNTSVPYGLRSTPLLYQYASHLKAQNQHLSSLAQHQNQAKRRSEVPRRNTLQRTQTYHLTAHSDYNNRLDNLADSYRSQAQYNKSNADVQAEFDQAYVPMERLDRFVTTTLPLREHTTRIPPNLPLQVSTEEYRDSRYITETMSPVSQISGFSQNLDAVSMSSKYTQDNKAKEKQWYESSLDSPPPTGPALPVKNDPPLLMKKSSNLKRSPSVGTAQAYELMSSSGRQSALISPGHGQNIPLSPNKEVPLESPKNLTVIEQGKWIPYREVTKPFEMSDFYKYSTKFRQSNMNQRPQVNSILNTDTPVGYGKSPMDLPQYASEKRHEHL